MRIALLNLPLDNNYGGNLQRYALIKVIQNMGHEVYHIFLVRQRLIKWYKKPFAYTKRFVMRYILSQKDVVIRSESMFNKNSKLKNHLALRFYEQNIPHSKMVYTLDEITKISNQSYDCFIVGSDQVWRKRMTRQIGLYNYFFDFLGRRDVKRIAYGVSMGTNDNELVKSEIKELGKLYKRFDAVSVRESFMLNLFTKYGWKTPSAYVVLDPTLLLKIEDYRMFIDGENASNSQRSRGKIYCYILDKNTSTERLICDMSSKLNKDSIITSLDNSFQISIEQWLNDIYYADCIITDSYHGTVFSILFNKNFIFVGNHMRGNERISSLFDLLGINNQDTMHLDWQSINRRISELRLASLVFLKENL